MTLLIGKFIETVTYLIIIGLHNCRGIYYGIDFKIELDKAEFNTYKYFVPYIKYLFNFLIFVTKIHERR